MGKIREKKTEKGKNESTTNGGEGISERSTEIWRSRYRETRKKQRGSKRLVQKKGMIKS